MKEQYPDSLFSPHYPADRHCLRNRHCHPEHILAVILALNISLGLTLFLVFMLSSMVMKISADHSHSHSLTVFLVVFCVTFFLFCVAFFLFFFPHRELVRFVEPYCRCIVNSLELMEILLLHIKLPIPYNWLFSMPDFIKPTIPLHWLFAGENMKNGWGTARSKERKVWPDDLCFLQFIDNLESDWMNSLWIIWNIPEEF